MDGLPDLIKKLRVNACAHPVHLDRYGRWEFPCGLAVSDRLVAAQDKLVVGAVEAMSAAHLAHHVEGHPLSVNMTYIIGVAPEGYYAWCNCMTKIGLMPMKAGPFPRKIGAREVEA